MTRRKKIFGGIALFLALAVVTFGFVLSHDSACPPPVASGPTTAGQTTAGATTMKAVMQRCYGGPEALRVENIEKPAPGAGELLVKVRAAGVNPLDHHTMHGKPYVMRMGAGFGAPHEARFGIDFAGVVEAVGSGVTKFKVGDEVIGARTGAFAQYIVVNEARNVVAKPPHISFEQAAGVPIAAVTALQALRDKGALKPGQKVLINGASGGVGTFAVQIAKALGAEVTAVCSTRNVELVRSLGADHVIDYTRTDFTAADVQYDVIIDSPGNRDFGDLRKIMADDGRYVLVGGPKTGRWLGPIGRALRAKMYSPFVSQKFDMMLAELNPADLKFIADLMAVGKVTTVVDRRYTLEQVGDAIGYVELGHARGKVVLPPE